MQFYVAGQDLSPAVFRFEPFILAVEARDMQAAQTFLQIARQAGFRESGATASGAAPQRIIVGIRCSIRLEVSRADSANGSWLANSTLKEMIYPFWRLPRCIQVACCLSVIHAYVMQFWSRRCQDCNAAVCMQLWRVLLSATT